MFEKLRKILAEKRVKRAADYAVADKQFAAESHDTQIVLWPVRMLGRALRWTMDTVVAICRWIWEMLRNINVTELIHIVLLVAIIILFLILISNVIRKNYQKHAAVTPSDEPVVETVAPVIEPEQNITENHETISVETETVAEPVNAPVAEPKPEQIAAPRIVYNQIFGDVIIESKQESVLLKPGARINGNVYLQNMRKFVLPCGVRIEGNLFLRDLNMLQFCGDFTVTGNIYVSPRSSFGPIPNGAKLGGQIIL